MIGTACYLPVPGSTRPPYYKTRDAGTRGEVVPATVSKAMVRARQLRSRKARSRRCAACYSHGPAPSLAGKHAPRADNSGSQREGAAPVAPEPKRARRCSSAEGDPDGQDLCPAPAGMTPVAGSRGPCCRLVGEGGASPGSPPLPRPRPRSQRVAGVKRSVGGKRGPITTRIFPAGPASPEPGGSLGDARRRHPNGQALPPRPHPRPRSWRDATGRRIVGEGGST